MSPSFDKKQISEKLKQALDELERIMGDIGQIRDDLLIQHLLETGEIDLDENEDFLTR